jgi:putative SOS response-associated peptidase YedK
MCNLYRMTKAADEVARLFGAEAPAPANAGGEFYPGYPGWVVAQGRMASMTWGFPLVLKGARGQPLKPRPVNNARTDNLASPFWRHAFEHGRCLIPVEAFAEAAGEKGAKTRTWFSVPDQPVFAVAGLWRNSAEFGPCYTMVMTEACIEIGDLHERMPVILTPAESRRWVETRDREEALALCRSWPHGLDVAHTGEAWTTSRVS